MKHAIIGCGRVAPNHVFGANEADIEIKWCCDLNNDKLDLFSLKHKVPLKTTKYFDVLEDDEINSISICTDHGSHAKIAIDALNMGKNIIIEKPIAINTNEAINIIKARDKNKRIVTVCFQHRFDPLIQKIKQIIDSGTLGRITAINANIQCSKNEEYYSSWRGKLKTEGGSTLINQGIHTLDLLIWFFGMPKVLHSKFDALKFSKIFFETEDTLVSLLEFNNKALCTFLTTNTSIVEWDSYIELIGTKGRISFTTDFPNFVLKFDSDNPNLKLNIENLSQSRHIPPPSMNYYGISHKDLLKNFFGTIKGNDSLFVTAEDGLRALETVEKIYKMK
jgi:UDP-N-acetyl-2-amino-2-deoxyglucuronate dehydrogenase